MNPFVSCTSLGNEKADFLISLAPFKNNFSKSMMEQKEKAGDYQEPPIVIHLISLYEIAHKIVAGFPKHERYAVGEKIEVTTLECLDATLSANIATKYEKEKFLLKLGVKIDLLKILFRLSLNLKFVEFKDYLEVEKELKELGKMAGGWIKFARREY